MQVIFQILLGAVIIYLILVLIVYIMAVRHFSKIYKPEALTNASYANQIHPSAEHLTKNLAAIIAAVEVLAIVLLLVSV